MTFVGFPLDSVALLTRSLGLSALLQLRKNCFECTPVFLSTFARIERVERSQGLQELGTAGLTSPFDVPLDLATDNRCILAVPTLDRVIPAFTHR